MMEISLSQGDVLYQVMGTWIYIVGFHRRVKVPSVRSILYSTTSLGSWDLPYMGDSIGDSIVTPYITNLMGKDPN